MDNRETIEYVISLCYNKTLNSNEILNVKHFFSDSVIDPNYNNGQLLTISALNGNCDMIKVLKEHNCNIHINENEPLRICAQNNYLDCALVLFDETVNVEEYDYSASYNNLRKIKENIYFQTH